MHARRRTHRSATPRRDRLQLGALLSVALLCGACSEAEQPGDAATRQGSATPAAALPAVEVARTRREPRPDPTPNRDGGAAPEPRPTAHGAEVPLGEVLSEALALRRAGSADAAGQLIRFSGRVRDARDARALADHAVEWTTKPSADNAYADWLDLAAEVPWERGQLRSLLIRRILERTSAGAFDDRSAELRPGALESLVATFRQSGDLRNLDSFRGALEGPPRVVEELRIAVVRWVGEAHAVEYAAHLRRYRDEPGYSDPLRSLASQLLAEFAAFQRREIDRVLAGFRRGDYASDARTVEGRWGHKRSPRNVGFEAVTAGPDLDLALAAGTEAARTSSANRRSHAYQSMLGNLGRQHWSGSPHELYALLRETALSSDDPHLRAAAFGQLSQANRRAIPIHEQIDWIEEQLRTYGDSGTPDDQLPIDALGGVFMGLAEDAQPPPDERVLRLMEELSASDPRRAAPLIENLHEWYGHARDRGLAPGLDARMADVVRPLLAPRGDPASQRAAASAATLWLKAPSLLPQLRALAADDTADPAARKHADLGVRLLEKPADDDW